MAERVPMADLAGLHAPLRAELDEAWARVRDGGRYVLGEEVQALERELAAFIGVAEAVGVSSGTDALLMALTALELPRGARVLCPALSFFATAEAILRAGLRPIFVDVDPETGLLCPAAARARAGEALAAVVVHLYGRCVDLPALDLGELPIIEDAAQAIGAQDARGRSAGSLGRLASFSFFPTKNLGALGDGGLVCTNEGKLEGPLRELRQHGLREGGFHRLGGNFRLDALQAAFLRVKLPHLPAWNQARADHALAYDRDLAELPLHRPPLQPGMVWHHYIVQHPERDRLRVELAARGVETGLYYPRPMPLEPALAHLGHRPGDFPGAEALCARALALPVHPALREDQRQRVVEALRHSLR